MLIDEVKSMACSEFERTNRSFASHVDCVHRQAVVEHRGFTVSSVVDFHVTTCFISAARPQLDSVRVVETMMKSLAAVVQLSLRLSGN